MHVNQSINSQCSPLRSVIDSAKTAYSWCSNKWALLHYRYVSLREEQAAMEVHDMTHSCEATTKFSAFFLACSLFLLVLHIIQPSECSEVSHHAF